VIEEEDDEEEDDDDDKEEEEESNKCSGTNPFSGVSSSSSVTMSPTEAVVVDVDDVDVDAVDADVDDAP